ncbi:MAG: HNH endonuclease [Actinomyces urogenitalis]|uniref:HNH endonuclease n=1 Tax=Actinomyces urogenitalis TaxID=103621 RepID=UPI003993EB68
MSKQWAGHHAQRILALLWRNAPHVCSICHEPITAGPGARLRDGSRDPMRASVDHTLARSRGGSDHLGNLRLAHLSCNAAKGARTTEPAPVVDGRHWFGVDTTPTPRHPGPRMVILLCGPPGSGKTTRATQLAGEHGLDVYDLDDPQWQGRTGALTSALSRIGDDPHARAVVIRAGATRTARARARLLIRPTAVQVLAVDADTCKRRVIERGRDRPPIRQQLAAVASWWQAYEPDP